MYGAVLFERAIVGSCAFVHRSQRKPDSKVGGRQLDAAVDHGKGIFKLIFFHQNDAYSKRCFRVVGMPFHQLSEVFKGGIQLISLVGLLPQLQ